MNLEQLLEYKAALQREYEKDIAAIDRIIRRLGHGSGTFGTPVSLSLADQLPRKQGRPPGGLIQAVRQAIRKMPGTPFTLNEIAEQIADNGHGGVFERKAISTALGRLASRRHEIRVLEKGVNGKSATKYVFVADFPQAR